MSAPSSSSIARTMTFDSQLIEDFIHTDEVLVSVQSPKPIAIFLNAQGESEALVISENGAGHHGLYHVVREPLSESGWNVYGISAAPTALAVMDGESAWCVGTDQQLWKNQAGTWSPANPGLPAGAQPIAPQMHNSAYSPITVDGSGTMWVAAGDGQLLRYDAAAKSWDPVTGGPALLQPPVGAAGNLWAVQAGNPFMGQSNYALNNASGSWQATVWPGSGCPAQISVGSDGAVWGLEFGTGNLCQYAGQAWQGVSGAPTLAMIAAGADSDLWGISSTSGQLLHLVGGSWQTVQFSPAAGVAAALVAAANDGTLWVVDNFGVSWKLPRMSGASWQRQMMPTGMSGAAANADVTEVVAGQDDQGAQAFYVSQGNLHHASLTSAGTWQPQLLPIAIGCGDIGVAIQSGSGALIVYGVTGDGNMLVVAKSSQSYRSTIVNAYGILKAAKLSVNVSDQNGWFTAAIIGGQLCVALGDAQYPLDNPGFRGLLSQVTEQSGGGSVPPDLKEIIRLPFVDRGGFYCAMTDSSGDVWMAYDIMPSPNPNNLNGWQANFVALTGPKAAVQTPVSAVASVGALVDLNQNARIYVTDASNRLWVIRQVATNDDNTWLWTNWHPLGNDCLLLANGPGSHATHELFTVNSDSFLHRLWQDPVSLNWDSSALLKPAGAAADPIYVAQYVTEVTVLNAAGTPEPGVAVSVSVNEPVSVWFMGNQYALSPVGSATFTTDAMGKLALNTLALGLHTAQLSFNAEGFASSYQAYPPQAAQDRLAAVDGPTLQSAQARTQSVPTVVTAPLVPSTGQPNCATAATVIQNVFTIKTRNNIDTGLVTGASATGAAPTYEDVRALWSAKVHKVRALAPATAGVGQESLGSWQSFWDELAAFGEDVWHGIRKGILAVEAITIDLGQGLIELTLVLEQVGSAVISFVIKTIDDVVHAVTTAFQWLGTKIEKAIDWLKAFFDWGDILNTKNVIEYYINQVIGNLITSLNPNSPDNFQQLVRAKFEQVAALIAGNPNQPGSDAFSQAATSFGTNSFNGAVSGIPVSPTLGGSALQPAAPSQAHAAHQVRCNYAQRKSQTYIHGGGNVMPGTGGSGVGTGPSPFDGFLALLAETLELDNPASKFCQAQATLQANLQSQQDPKGFFGTAVSDFVAMVKEFVLVVVELLEDVLVELLTLAGQALAAFQGVLNRQIDMPVISWLYAKISGHPLTLLDLFCLILAIPGTLIYKLVWGGSSASPPFTAQQVQAILGQPIPWPQLQGAALGITPSRQAALGAEQASALASTVGALSIVNAVLYGLVDMGTDIDTIGGGEVDWSTFWSGSAVVMSIAAFSFSVPYQVLAKAPDSRTVADNCTVALWGMGIAPIALNVVSLVASQEKRLAKYWEVKGPIATALVGGAQLGLGIYSAVVYSKPNSGYNAAYSAGGIITPLPSIGKLLLLPMQTEPLLILVPLDLICDLGSGACTAIETWAS